MFMLILAAAGAAAAPSAEAETLGRRLVETGTLAALLPLVSAKETEEMVADHPELTQAERAALRKAARATYAAGEARLMAATGHAYAQRLSVADLKALVAFNRSPAAARYRAATPAAIAETIAVLGPIDFKKETLAAFCRETGKLCAK